MAQATPDGVVHYVHADVRGDVRMVTDASGVVTDTVTYTVDGQVSDRTGVTPVTVGFNGEYTDQATGMVWLRARWYDPASGRFVSADPWHGNPATPVSLNRYLFANADVVNNVDPTGLLSMSQQAATVAVAATLASIAVVAYLQPDTALRPLPGFPSPQSAAVHRSVASVSPPGTDQCSDGYNGCGLPVFMPGADTADTTAHIVDALASSPSWAVLTRSDTHSRSWLSADSRCDGSSRSGSWCDEYPFASTLQGGREHRCARCPSADNNVEVSRMTKELANALVRLERTLGGLGATVVPIMRPGLGSDRVRSRLGVVAPDISPDSAIVDWFGWHDGAGDSQTSVKATHLVPGGEFLDLEFLIGEYQQACETARYVIETGPPTSLSPEDLWRPSWFPILGLSGKGLLAVELRKEREGAVHVVWWESALHERARVAWPSLRDFVDDVISRFESGEYWVDEVGVVRGEWIDAPRGQT